MARLRLFANLREVAGSSSVDISGASVGEVLDTAVERYGGPFSAALDTAQVWVNGDPAERSTAVGPGDEVAVIPPVSGGAEAAAAIPGSYATAVAAALVVALFAAAIASLEIFVLAVVAAGLAWVWDLTDVAKVRHVHLVAIPPLIAVALAANGAFGWGFAGFAMGVILGVVVSLVWAVVSSEDRAVDSISVTAVTGVIASVGAGALVLVRMRSVAEAVAFLVVVVAAGVLGGAAALLGDAVPVDRNLATLVGAVLGAVAVGLAADTISLPVALLGGGAVTAGIVAGNTFGSLARAGTVLHTQRPPGVLTTFDGGPIAALLFWLVLTIFA